MNNFGAKVMNKMAKVKDFGNDILRKAMTVIMDAKNHNKGGYKDTMNVMMLLSAFFVAAPAVMAAPNIGSEVITAILTVVYLITNILGIIFVIVGFVKLVISHAQEDAPGQQKAAMFIATGLVLILLRIVMGLINFAEWIDTNIA